MDHVNSFVDDSIANSENFATKSDPENPNGCIVTVSGYYNFKLTFNDPYHFSRGEGCSATSSAIKKILEQANNKRSTTQKEQPAAIREALLALRDGYLDQADALDEEAMEEDGEEAYGATNDEDDAAAQDAEAERVRREIERAKQAELDRMTPEERARKELVDRYLKQLQEDGSGRDTSMSQQATLRLLTDLARIQVTDKPGRGWSCEMQRGSMKHWIVKFTDFDKGSDLADDMDKWSKKHNKERAIVIEMTMDKEYPYRPPFVRVLRPQFVQFTAHVTLGGAICMLPLTDEGWNPSFDLESIIEMCRANICDKESKAKVILENGGDYQLHEAKDGFQRLVQTHGWKHRF